MAPEKREVTHEPGGNTLGMHQELAGESVGETDQGNAGSQELSDKRDRFGSNSALVAKEHSKINSLYEDLLVALEHRAHHRAYSCFARLRDALEIHFEFEDLIYFPTLKKILPQFSALINRLETDHVEFLAELNLVTQLLGANALEESRQRVETVAERIASHERSEESLIAEVKGTVIDDAQVPPRR